MSKKTSGRTLLTLMFLAALLVGSLDRFAQAAPSAAPTGQRLRNLAGSFLIGYEAMSDFRTISDTAQFQDVARSEFNFVTSENAMKWDATEPSQNSFNFTQADQLVSFAQANSQKVHGHTLVWHSQTPPWITNGSWNSTTLTNAMYNHIDKVVNHWADGQIYAWDVVNEAFNEDGSRRSSVFQNVIGNSFIELAFRRARAADPVAKLIYNDYNVETVNSKSNAMYNMVADFKNRGVPIDGVGLQMHLAGGIDYNSLAQNMQRFANIGVEIYITEMDVRYPTPISSTNLQAQATVYRNVLDTCLKQPACKALQIWGITDRHSWVPGTFPGTGDALIFDSNYNVETVNSKSTAMYNMVADFKNRGVPIDGVGFQMHLAGGIDASSLAQNMQRFANIGVEIYITEMDVRYPTPISSTNLQAQATVYRNVLDVCLKQPACKALQTWGVTDRHSWVPGTFPGTGDALIFDSNYNPKPAYYALQSRLSQSPQPTNTPTPVTRTPTPVTPTPTRTPTPITPTPVTPTPVTSTPVTETPVTPTPITPTPVTPTPGSGETCSPVTGTISAPFSYDGAGTFCWQIANIPSYINSWNLDSLTVNGVSFTNLYAFPTNLPPKINGFWYVSYRGQYPWSHFEAR